MIETTHLQSLAQGASLLLSFVALTCCATARWQAHRTKRLDIYRRRMDVYTRTLAFWSLLNRFEPHPIDSDEGFHCDSPALRYARELYDDAVKESTFLFAGDPAIEALMVRIKEDLDMVLLYHEVLYPSMCGTVELSPYYDSQLETKERIKNSIPLLLQSIDAFLTGNPSGKSVGKKPPTSVEFVEMSAKR